MGGGGCYVRMIFFLKLWKVSKIDRKNGSKKYLWDDRTVDLITPPDRKSEQYLATRTSNYRMKTFIAASKCADEIRLQVGLENK